MRSTSRICALLLILIVAAPVCFASAYNARPRLVVVIVIDQFRGDYLERYRDQFGEGGFRLFLDRGADFTNCDYDYANTRTSPGHATLLTGAYSDGHGIVANEWWDPQKKRMVGSVFDDGTQLVGVSGQSAGVSPRNLMADTLGDQLKLATEGKSRVYAVSLKDYAAVLSGGFAADGAFWIDHKSGAWISSSYYGKELPQWVQDFNNAKHAESYLNREWEDRNGNVLRTTTPPAGKEANFYGLVGSTPFANDYEFDFARELVTQEKLGSGSATDLLAISLSANDILGHGVGPDSPEMHAMALATDRQLAAFFDFLGHQIGLANVWIALSADHGIAPVPAFAEKLRIPAQALSAGLLREQLNATLSKKLSPGHAADYVKDFDYPLAWLDNDAFAAIHMKEADAERAVGEAMLQVGIRQYFTKAQLASGEVPRTALGLQYLHSYSPEGGWYVMGVSPPFAVGVLHGTDHGTPYHYDTHVPLAFYGLPFRPGTYRTHAEPVDLAVTFASLLGINAPTQATGHVLTEALVPARREGAPESWHERPAEHIQPASLGRGAAQ
jgi:predicted AlkP superfamily pyrophosphatase or phosphodiesterase